jgi:hypothetical protein
VDEDIKSRVNLSTGCYHSEQSVLSSSLLVENIDVKTQTTVLLMLFALLKVELKLTHRRRHRVFENGTLSTILGSTREDVLGGCTGQGG